MPIDYKELENDDDSLRSSTEHSCAAANAVFFFWILSSRSNGALCYVRTRGKTMHFTLGPWRGTPPQGTKLRERDIVRYFGLHHKLYGPQAHKLKTTKSWAWNWALLSWALNESAHLSHRGRPPRTYVLSHSIWWSHETGMSNSQSDIVGFRRDNTADSDGDFMG